MNLQDIRDEVLAAELTSRGWHCSKSEWETPSGFSRRMGRHPDYLSMLISRGAQIPGLEVQRALTGDRKRIIMVRVSPETEAWMSKRQRVRPI